MAMIPPTVINIKESEWKLPKDVSWYCEIDEDSRIRVIFQKVPDNYPFTPIENAGSDITIAQIELSKMLYK